jgi:hypothetical protein
MRQDEGAPHPKTLFHAAFVGHAHVSIRHTQADQCAVDSLSALLLLKKAATADRDGRNESE